MKNLREALEKYKRNKMSKATFEDDYMEGFQDCADILFPLVEALEFYNKPKELSKNCPGYCVEYSDIALQALADLKAKLGVE